MPKKSLQRRLAKIASLILAPLSLYLEFYALVPLLEERAGADILFRFFLLHAIACIGFALMAFPYMPLRYQRQKASLLLLLFVLPFFMPIVGGAGLVGGMLIAMLFPLRASSQLYATLKEGEFSKKTGDRNNYFGHGAVRSLLINRQISLERRLRALLSLESLQARKASEILREVLQDSEEDIRLVAYGILDKREKSIQNEIAVARRRLHYAPDEQERLSSLRNLAQLEWELIYEGLSQGDVRTHVIIETQRLLDVALMISPNDANLWYMKGRLAIEIGSDDEALEAFQRALDFGLPRGRVLPYLAELAFHARRFEDVRQYMTELATVPMMAGLRPMAAFWGSREIENASDGRCLSAA